MLFKNNKPWIKWEFLKKTYIPFIKMQKKKTPKEKFSLTQSVRKNKTKKRQEFMLVLTLRSIKVLSVVNRIENVDKTKNANRMLRNKNIFNWLEMELKWRINSEQNTSRAFWHSVKLNFSRDKKKMCKRNGVIF